MYLRFVPVEISEKDEGTKSVAAAVQETCTQRLLSVALCCVPRCALAEVGPCGALMPTCGQLTCRAGLLTGHCMAARLSAPYTHWLLQATEAACWKLADLWPRSGAFPAVAWQVRRLWWVKELFGRLESSIRQKVMALCRKCDDCVHIYFISHARRAHAASTPHGVHREAGGGSTCPPLLAGLHAGLFTRNLAHHPLTGPGVWGLLCWSLLPHLLDTLHTSGPHALGSGCLHDGAA